LSFAIKDHGSDRGILLDTVFDSEARSIGN
jgi:hypothetical protein